MPSELLSLTIETEDGNRIPLNGTQDRQSPTDYRMKREQFCRLMAQGDLDIIEAYCQAYGRQMGVSNRLDTIIENAAGRLHRDPAILLRIEQIKEPVARKHKKKLEYTLQRAFAQCDEAYNLARVTLDAKAMLKAIELQGKFAKLLAEQINVNHTVGVLDEASTEVLLEMKKQLEKKVKKDRKLLGPVVEAEVTEITNSLTP